MNRLLSVNQIGDYLSRYKGELFLLFHNIQVARHAGQSTAKSTEAKSIKASQTYLKNLTELLGPNSDKDWKPQWLKLKNKPQSFERWARRYFMNRILKETRFKGVASFEIKEKYDDVRPQYSIVVCSNHPGKAFGEFLNESFSEENKSLFHQDKDKNFVSTSSFLEKEWNKQVEVRKKEIRPVIIEILKEHNTKWIELKEVITIIILNILERGYGLGYLKRPEYRNMMIELYEENVIEARSLGKKGRLILSSDVKLVHKY